MGSREAPYDKHKECDVCGEMGAHDFMGDYFCDNCVISYPDSDSVIQTVGLDAYTELGESHDAHVKEVERLQKELDELNNLKLVDQNGELLLECTIGDKYHQALLELGITKLLEDYLKEGNLGSLKELDCEGIDISAEKGKVNIVDIPGFEGTMDELDNLVNIGAK